MGSDGAGNLRNVEDAFAPLLSEQFVQAFPDLSSSFGRWSQKRSISFIRFIVLLDEVSNIDFFLVEARMKSSPWGLQFVLFGRCNGSHLILPLILGPGRDQPQQRPGVAGNH